MLGSESPSCEGVSIRRLGCCRYAGGIITIADVNSACSLERNSLVFLQAARSGLTHEHVLQHIVSNARRRAEMEPLPEAAPSVASTVLLPATMREVGVAHAGCLAEQQTLLIHNHTAPSG